MIKMAHTKTALSREPQRGRNSSFGKSRVEMQAEARKRHRLVLVNIKEGLGRNKIAARNQISAESVRRSTVFLAGLGLIVLNPGRRSYELTEEGEEELRMPNRIADF